MVCFLGNPGLRFPVRSKVFVVFLSAFFPILVNTIAGVKALDEDLLRAARSFCATDRQIFATVLRLRLSTYLEGRSSPQRPRDHERRLSRQPSESSPVPLPRPSYQARGRELGIAPTAWSSSLPAA